MSKFCPQCKTELANTDNSCPQCGTEIARTDAELAEAKYGTQSTAPATQSTAPCLPLPSAPIQNIQYTQSAPTYAPPAEAVRNENLRLGETLGIILVSGIPIAGLIMMLIFAFGAEAQRRVNRATLAKALLIMRLASIAIIIIVYIMMIVLLVGTGLLSEFIY